MILGGCIHDGQLVITGRRRPGTQVTGNTIECAQPTRNESAYALYGLAKRLEDTIDGVDVAFDVDLDGIVFSDNQLHGNCSAMVALWQRNQATLRSVVVEDNVTSGLIWGVRFFGGVPVVTPVVDGNQLRRVPRARHVIGPSGEPTPYIGTNEE